MVFSSHIFLFYFLPAVLLVYYLLPFRYKNTFLTIASYAFYGWFKPWYIILMLTATCVNYISGIIITKEGAKQRDRVFWLVISVVVNLGLLGFFKYYMFIAGNINELAKLFGMEGFGIMRIILPIGISFYTFQAMSYTIDVYRGTTPPVKSFFDLACFVALFPQLIAGPIVRYNTVAEQIQYREFTVPVFTRGAVLFMIGFAKKILLANPCGIIADACFDAQAPGVFDAWYGAMAYSFQIYFDFCAYSDMAVGLGRMLGFEFLKNFNSPYISKSITELWRRWHISLSTWLRDYLYIPLGGNRKGEVRTYINLALTMILGGLWHGAAWQFILWGTYHGVLLGFERWRGRESIYSRLPVFLQIAITYTLMLFSWVFFRAENLTLALRYFGAMFGLVKPATAAAVLGTKIYTPYLVFFFLLCAVFSFTKYEAMDWVDEGVTLGKAIVVILVFIFTLATMFSQAFNPFIYFQF